ncbi:MAG: Hsp70 family protein [Thermoanaerobaculum sp.]|nr:Hsp70 family protein [Thermoanaerobaculum sp.]
MIPSHKLATNQSPVRVLGIDLGTTTSAVVEGIWDSSVGGPGPLRALEIPQPTPEGTSLDVFLPSVVAIANGKVWVGEGAKRLGARMAEWGLIKNQSFFAETKNEIGLRRTYPKAPEGFRSPTEIAAWILKTLLNAARTPDAPEAARVVVTVPASFQVHQRAETRRAAELAGLTVQGGDLLDEPIAAFLDYLLTYGEAKAWQLEEEQNLVVFDFGGGTCDVAVLTVAVGDGQLQASTRAVSRYHRLGGGDLDAAIVFEVLLPQICRNHPEANELLDYFTKKGYAEPALRGVAEALKISLCEEVDRLRALGAPLTRDTSVTLAIRHTFQVPGSPTLFSLHQPQLSLGEWEKLLGPFVERDLPMVVENEYRTVASIFCPVEDALGRAGLSREQVDLCLLAGGSSLIPQVRDALRAYFPRATFLRFPTAEATRLAVARGAAWHALALAQFGRGIVKQRAHEELALRTDNGLFPLVPAGASLPYPSTGHLRREGLLVPQTSLTEPLPLRVEVVRLRGGQQEFVHGGVWNLPPPVTAGTPLLVEYRLDENQVLNLTLRFSEAAEAPGYSCQVENPLTHVTNPSAERLELEEVEEQIRSGDAKGKEPSQLFERMADLAWKLGQKDKAFSTLSRLIRQKPTVSRLNSLAILAEEMGKITFAEKCHREALRLNPYSTTSRFNLALLLYHQQRYQEAQETLSPALMPVAEVPFWVLAAIIAKALGDTALFQQYLDRALERKGTVWVMTEWELGWLEQAAHLRGQWELVGTIQEVRRQRLRSAQPQAPAGYLPRLKDDWLA